MYTICARSRQDHYLSEPTGFNSPIPFLSSQWQSTACKPSSTHAQRLTRPSNVVVIPNLKTATAGGLHQAGEACLADLLKATH